MGFAADFTAIDFETANRRLDSACQLAAVTVRNGQIVDRSMWMIRPEPFYFSSANIQIHGIAPQAVEEESTFGDLWPEIKEKLGDDCIVAHNASFDMGVLLGCLRTHQHQVPELQFTCTRAIARRTWPQHRRYGLKPLSNWLGVQFRHHDALEDSIACAKILLAAGIDQEAKSLEDLEKRLRLSRGRAGSWGQRSPTGARKRRRNQAPGSSMAGSDATGHFRQSQLPFLYPNQVASGEGSVPRDESNPDLQIDLQRLMIRAEFIRPLSGRQVVFTGRFRQLSPQDARALATRLGATCQDKVDGSTDYLVVGTQGQASGSAGRREVNPRTGDKQQFDQRQTAEQLAARGKPIKIVDEDEFLSLLISGPG